LAKDFCEHWKQCCLVQHVCRPNYVFLRADCEYLGSKLHPKGH